MRLAKKDYTEEAQPVIATLSDKDYSDMKDAVKAKLKTDADVNDVTGDLDILKKSMRADYLVTQKYASNKRARGIDFDRAFTQAIEELVKLGYQHKASFVPEVAEKVTAL